MSTPASRALLLACARSEGGRAEHIDTLVEGPLDWPDFLAGVTRHGLASLAAVKLRYAAVPASVRDELNRLERANVVRSLYLASHVRTCLTYLADAGHEAISWKGPALAHQVFGDITRRSSGDIDFLVKPGELATAGEALLRAGFRFEDWAEALSTRRRSRMSAASGEIRLRAPGSAFLVELHQQFLPTGMEDPRVLSEMWDRSFISPAWDGGLTRKLETADLLLTLCVHATKHGWDRLKWVADVAALLEQSSTELDWDQLFARADRYGVRGMLLAGLGIAHRTCGAPLCPEAVREFAGHSKLKMLLEEQDSVYVRDTLPRKPFAHSLALCLATESLPTRIIVTARESVAITWMDIAEFPGSDRWLWLVPLYRAWRLARRHVAPTLWSAFAGNSVGRVLSRWLRLGSSEKHFVLRAALVVLLVRLALSLLPFQRVLSITDRYSAPRLRLIGTSDPSPQHCARWIPSVARVVPRASCLTQALAARWLLRSKGAPCELQLGVAKRVGKFCAHAVLLHDGNVVVGGRPLVEQRYERIFSC